MVSRILAWGVGVLLCGLYLYATITGVGNLTGMLGLSGALGTGLSVTGWIWLSVGILLPLLVLAAALVLGRGRKPGIRILLLAAGIAAIAVWQLDLMHVIPESSYFA
ncbi:hypothetical protein [Leucobacter luti]|uniref:Uncharacterized protein n=1 Tax=Leucobacter luti TaxID=340320 RepID=A0A4R6S492_9MICO|nr:hypothetical protein [Leucobacter luti]MCW2287308.1 putative RDD family membrane protein YckC [Leucobacter luti]QYM76624.1 hypothetical protein K1X41_04155 [Leucobacter luti]TCK41531.1 hypothetical protein EDF60_1962 [Leucobacter luti]TDP94512.1 hypothetical protein EDF62_0931 [Leucobacter luti]